MLSNVWSILVIPCIRSTQTQSPGVYVQTGQILKKQYYKKLLLFNLWLNCTIFFMPDKNIPFYGVITFEQECCASCSNLMAKFSSIFLFIPFVCFLKLRMLSSILNFIIFYLLLYWCYLSLNNHYLYKPFLFLTSARVTSNAETNLLLTP